MTNLIAAAVAPLKPIQMDRAEKMVRDRFARIEDLVAKSDGTMAGIIANHKADYEAKGWKVWDQDLVSLRKSVGEFFRADWATGKLSVVPGVVEARVSDARFTAAQSYDAYVMKMVGKVGDVTEATMQTSSHVWGYSVLEVVTVAGERQIWTTQQIVNCSVLGKLFNQWPTRLAASKASQKKALKALAA